MTSSEPKRGLRKEVKSVTKHKRGVSKLGEDSSTATEQRRESHAMGKTILITFLPSLFIPSDWPDPSPFLCRRCPRRALWPLWCLCHCESKAKSLPRHGWIEVPREKYYSRPTLRGKHLFIYNAHSLAYHFKEMIEKSHQVIPIDEESQNVSSGLQVCSFFFLNRVKGLFYSLQAIVLKKESVLHHVR